MVVLKRKSNCECDYATISYWNVLPMLDQNPCEQWD